MATTLNPAARNLMASPLGAALAGGRLAITGASGDLGTVVLPNPAFGAPANGLLTLAAPVEITTTAAGVATGWQVRSADGSAVVSGGIGITGSTAEMILTRGSLDFVAGEIVRVSALTLTMPAVA